MSSTTFFSYYSLYFTLILLARAQGGLATTFTLVNKCDFTIWPGILPNAGSSSLSSTGFQLQPGSARSFQAQPGWSGRFWARTGCTLDPTTTQFTCVTGHCGSNQLECNGAGATPPATLAEFTIGSNDPDFYDVSLVDGYNLPVIVKPVGGSGACGSTGCAADVNRVCPRELRAGGGQACRSACDAFRSDEYCCSGAFGSPERCRPSVYAAVFKGACPRAYSYAYDDATSTFTCAGADYTITFCPSVTSQKSSSPTTAGNTDGQPPPAAATNMAEGSSSQPQYNYYTPAYLPNFIIGGSSSHFYVNYNLIISVATCSHFYYRLIISNSILISDVD